MNETISIVLGDVAYVVLGLVVLFAAKLALDILTPFKVDDQLSARDNPAFGTSLIGYYLGVIAVYIGAMTGDTVPDRSLLADLGEAAAWALGGIVLLNVSRLVLDRLVLRRFASRDQIINKRNVAMGAAEFGAYVGSGLVVAGAISGEGGSVSTEILSALVFWALGQLGIIIYAAIYQALTRYDFQDEIEQANTAAGVAYAGNIIAMGLLMMRGSAGDLTSWTANLTAFAVCAVTAFVLLGLGRWLVDLVLLPGRTLHQEIGQDRNLSAGLLEAGTLVGLSAIVFFAI